MLTLQAQDNGQEIAALACESEDSVYEFTGPTGIIQTPNFPDDYFDYENCEWLIVPDFIGPDQVSNRTLKSLLLLLFKDNMTAKLQAQPSSTSGKPHPWRGKTYLIRPVDPAPPRPLGVSPI